METIAREKLPVGWLFDTVVSWLKIHAAWLFDFIRSLLGFFLDTTLDFLMNPPLIMPFLLLFTGFFTRSYFLRVFLVVFFLFLTFLEDQISGNVELLSVIAMLGLLIFFIVRKNGSVLYTLMLFILFLLAVAGQFFLEAVVPKPVVFISIVAILSWFMQERWSVVCLTVFGFLFVINQGYWQDTMETLSILLWSCILCMGIGVPFGIFSAHHPRFYRFLQPVLDLMQTLPAFVYIIPALFFFRIGMVPGLIATLIFVLPAPIRLTQAGISSTPETLREVANAFGASRWQLLWKVELPYAFPEIRASMTQTIMLSLSMVVISATVGGNGLGVKVYRALQTGNVALGFEAGCIIVVVAVVLDRLFCPGRREKACHQ